MIFKKFFKKSPKSEPRDSYKLDLIKKKLCMPQTFDRDADYRRLLQIIGYRTNYNRQKTKYFVTL